MWFMYRSATVGWMPSSSHFVRKVRLRSCNRQPEVPDFAANIVLDFENPLKHLAELLRAGNTSFEVVEHADELCTSEAVSGPMHIECDRLFLVSHAGNRSSSSPIISRVRFA